MDRRFDEVLNEASKNVAKWPEWRKSEALKVSEKRLRDQLSSKESDNQAKKQAASA